jgi:hypothetical protein
MPTQAQIIQMQRKPEARFACSACGADRGCDCNAPAVEKLAKQAEQVRQRMKRYRENKPELRNAPVDNVEEIEKRLNAVGKPFSPQYDPHYKIRTPLTSISRLYRRNHGFPAVRDDAPQVEPMVARGEKVARYVPCPPEEHKHPLNIKVRSLTDIVVDIVNEQIDDLEWPRKMADDLIKNLISAAIETGIPEDYLIDAFNRRFGIKQSALAA